jgi:hypothetical protein
MSQFERAILWRALDQPGAGTCSLWRRDASWILEGTAVMTVEGRPAVIGYQITADALWQTRIVTVKLAMGPTGRDLKIVIDDDQVWYVGSTELVTVRGCFDVDLSVTPATYTLPIRRMRLGVGASRPVTAAAISFPGLNVAPVEQTYTHLAESVYHVEGGGLSAEIEVDDLGLARRVEGGWVCEATA